VDNWESSENQKISKKKTIRKKIVPEEKNNNSPGRFAALFVCRV